MDYSKEPNRLVGRTKAKVFDNGGMIINFSLNVESLKELTILAESSKGYANIDIQQSREGNWYAMLSKFYHPGGTGKQSNLSQKVTSAFEAPYQPQGTVSYNPAPNTQAGSDIPF